jgi:hypothetical protein
MVNHPKIIKGANDFIQKVFQISHKYETKEYGCENAMNEISFCCEELAGIIAEIKGRVKRVKGVQQ